MTKTHLGPIELGLKKWVELNLRTIIQIAS
jgi:hypothetical protein